MFYSLLLALFSAQALGAETPMSGAEFERYSTGKTIHYADQNQSFGAEQYLPNRHVRWSYQNGPCKDGIWYENDELICFVYDDDPEPKCWAFYQRNGHLVAIYENDRENPPLLETKQSRKPLLCLGPQIGV